MIQMSQFSLNEARGYQSFDHEVVPILDRICMGLEITPEMFKQAEKRYQSITDYLCENGTSMAPYKPWLYPQGSANLGLTVKPDYDNEFDVDVICQLILANRPTQEAFVSILFECLKQRGMYTLRR